MHYADTRFMENLKNSYFQKIFYSQIFLPRKYQEETIILRINSKYESSQSAI